MKLDSELTLDIDSIQNIKTLCTKDLDAALQRIQSVKRHLNLLLTGKRISNEQYKKAMNYLNMISSKLNDNVYTIRKEIEVWTTSPQLARKIQEMKPEDLLV